METEEWQKEEHKHEVEEQKHETDELEEQYRTFYRNGKIAE